MGDLESTPGLERSPAEENGYPIQDSGLENSPDRGAWWTPWGPVHGVAKGRTRLSDLHTAWRARLSFLSLRTAARESQGL